MISISNKTKTKIGIDVRMVTIFNTTFLVHCEKKLYNTLGQNNCVSLWKVCVMVDAMVIARYNKLSKT